MNRQIRIPHDFSRRDVLKLGLMTGISTLIGYQGFRPGTAFASCGSAAGVIEAFPTTPLILNPFTDELPVPVPLAPCPVSEYTAWSTRPEPYTGGQQDCDGSLHQLGCASLGLPAPLVYNIKLQVAAHQFTSSPVQAIDKNGQDTVSYDEFGNDRGVGPQTLPASTIYGFNGTFPGPMIYARYGQPCLVRFQNQLHENPLNLDRGNFGAEDLGFLTHLHNGHTAPESDGNPNWKPGAYEPGDWCDNLYLNWPPAGDDREKQSFLWFHDHRMDHTSANVYKGMVGLYPIYDPGKDDGNEKKGYRLPGVLNPATKRVDYDIPLAIYDCCLDDGTTPHQDFHNGCGEPHPEWWGKTFFRHFPNHGFVGDLFTVNGKAFPVLKVKRRRYRLRFLDASIARLYRLELMSSSSAPVASRDTGRTGVKLQGQYQLPDGERCMKMVQIASEGGLLPYPFLRDSIDIWPAKRREVIVDFSKYLDGTPTTPGDAIYLVNVRQMVNGRKPTEATETYDDATGLPLPTPVENPDFDPDFRVPIMKFVVEGGAVTDGSIDPLVYANGTCSLKLAGDGLPALRMRARPSVPQSFKGVTTRTFELQRSGRFGGEIQWLINDHEFQPDHDLAMPIKGTGELWTIRNGSGGWVHPLHIHEEEHSVVSRNGVLVPRNVADPRLYSRSYGGQEHPDDVGKEDVVGLDPNEEVAVYRRFRSFTNKYVSHCHNLAHEDHAMMFGWQIVAP